MNKSSLYTNQRGFTLIEALIAIVIVTIGILTVMTMQVRAIGASSTAMNRTEATGIARALVESFHNVKFDSPNLQQTGATGEELQTAVTSQQIQGLIAAGKVRRYGENGFEEMEKLITALPERGKVIDSSGIAYQLAWAVQDLEIDWDGKAICKNIWVFMTWRSPMGENRLKMTTVLLK